MAGSDQDSNGQPPPPRPPVPARQLRPPGQAPIPPTGERPALPVPGRPPPHAEAGPPRPVQRPAPAPPSRPIQADDTAREDGPSLHRTPPAPHVPAQVAAPRPAPPRASQPLAPQAAQKSVPPPVPPPSDRAPRSRPGAIRALDWSSGRPLNGRYRMVQKLGEGGMGAVWLCDDILLRRKVALKTLFADRHQVTDEDLERFRREVAIAHTINHENIARTYDLGEAAGVHYLTMEFLEGETLVDRLKKGDPLGPQELREVAIPLCQGLRAAHKAGVVHRDLKPANVMLVNDTRKVVVMDFGIAAAVDESEPQEQKLQPVANVPWEVTSAGRGTPTYMAPEQWAGQRGDQRTDVYALGIILYVCLTKKVPYKAGSSQELSDLHQSAPVPRVEALAPNTPRDLANLIARCMAKRPEDRPQSMDEVLDVLERGKGRRAYVWQVLGVSAALAAVLALVGLGMWSLSHRTVIREMRPSMGRLAELIALQVNAADLDQIQGESDVDSPAFKRVHAVLQRYHQRYPETKSLYVMKAMREANQYAIVVDLYPHDTDQDGDKVISDEEKGALPGEPYDGSDSPFMVEALKGKGPVADEDFSTDDWGIALSGYCAIHKDGAVTKYFAGADASNDPLARFKVKLFVILGALWVLLAVGFAVVRARIAVRRGVTAAPKTHWHRRAMPRRCRNPCRACPPQPMEPTLRHPALIALLAAALVGVGFAAARVLAVGAPTQAPLVYAGTVTDAAGKPYPTAVEVTVAFSCRRPDSRPGVV